MNLKPNLWTLLFLLAAGGLAYVLFVPSENEDAGESDLVKIEEPPSLLGGNEDEELPFVRITEIDSSMFRDYYRNYETRFWERTAYSGKCPELITANLQYYGIKAYMLAEKEIEQMNALLNPPGDKNPNQEVYVYPIIKDNPQSRSGQFGLAFLVTDNDGTQRFFDFTEPCPPVCDTAQIAWPYVFNR